MLNELKYTFGNYLAFSRESLLTLVESYHRDLSPLPLLGLILGLMLFALCLTDRIKATVWLRLSLILAGLGWLLIGAIWQMRYLSQLDWSAAPMGWIMLVQGTLLILLALLWNPVFSCSGVVRWAAVLTAALGGFGLGLLQWLGGLPFSQLDRFGVDAGSTMLMTAALVMFLPRAALWLLLIPWLWTLRQFTTSWPLGDGVGMLLLPWLTACILLCLFLKRTDERQTTP